MHSDYTPISADIFHELVKRISNHSLHLASLPDLIIKVNNVLSDERKGVNDVAKVIQSEVALSTRIMHIANSPAIRSSKQITSITEAINRLGMDLIKNLAICVSLKDKFNSKDLVHADLMHTAMATSIQRSVIGMLISKYLVPTSSSEVALIGGLVSQLGHTVIIKYIDEQKELKHLSKDVIIGILDKYGAEVSELILCIWGFPTSIIDALFSRVVPNLATPTTNADVLALATAYITRTEETEVFATITEIISLHPEEYKAIKSIIV